MSGNVEPDQMPHSAASYDLIWVLIVWAGLWGAGYLSKYLVLFMVFA